MTSITKEDVLKDPLTLGRCFKEHAEPHGHLTRA